MVFLFKFRDFDKHPNSQNLTAFLWSDKELKIPCPRHREKKNVVSGIPRGLCGAPRTHQKKRISQCQQRAQGTQKGLEMHVHRTFYIDYSLWLKACHFKLKVFLKKNKRQPKYGRTAIRNSKKSVFKVFSIRATDEKI